MKNWLLGFFAVLALGARADYSNTWTNRLASGWASWNTSGNWDAKGVPSTDGSADAYFDYYGDGTGDRSVQVDSAVSVKSLTIKEKKSGSVTFGANGSAGGKLTIGAGGLTMIPATKAESGVAEASSSAAGMQPNIAVPIHLAASQSWDFGHLRGSENTNYRTISGNLTSASGIDWTLIGYYTYMFTAGNSSGFQGRAHVQQPIVFLGQSQFGRLGSTIYLEKTNSVDTLAGHPMLFYAAQPNETSVTIPSAIQMNITNNCVSPYVLGDKKYLLTFNVNGLCATNDYRFNVTQPWSGKAFFGAMQIGSSYSARGECHPQNRLGAMRVMMDGDNSQLFRQDGVNTPAFYIRGLVELCNNNAISVGNRANFYLGVEFGGANSGIMGVLLSPGVSMNGAQAWSSYVNVGAGGVFCYAVLGASGPGAEVSVSHALSNGALHARVCYYYGIRHRLYAPIGGRARFKGTISEPDEPFALEINGGGDIVLQNTGNTFRGGVDIRGGRLIVMSSGAAGFAEKEAVMRVGGTVPYAYEVKAMVAMPFTSPSGAYLTRYDLILDGVTYPGKYLAVHANSDNDYDGMVSSLQVGDLILVNIPQNAESCRKRTANLDTGVWSTETSSNNYVYNGIYRYLGTDVGNHTGRMFERIETMDTYKEIHDQAYGIRVKVTNGRKFAGTTWFLATCTKWARCYLATASSSSPCYWTFEDVNFQETNKLTGETSTVTMSAGNVNFQFHEDAEAEPKTGFMIGAPDVTIANRILVTDNKSTAASEIGSTVAGTVTYSGEIGLEKEVTFWPATNGIVKVTGVISNGVSGTSFGVVGGGVGETDLTAATFKGVTAVTALAGTTTVSKAQTDTLSLGWRFDGQKTGIINVVGDCDLAGKTLRFESVGNITKGTSVPLLVSTGGQVMHVPSVTGLQEGQSVTIENGTLVLRQTSYVFNWINTDSSRRGLRESSTDWEGGSMPVAYSSSASQTNDLFVFASDIAAPQTISGTTAGWNSPYYMGTLLGTAGHYVTCVAGYNYRSTVLKDASEFDGAIGAEEAGWNNNEIFGASGGWYLYSSLAQPTRVRNFRAQGAPVVGVMTAGATGVLDHVSGFGLLRAPHQQGQFDSYAKENAVVEIGSVEGGRRLAAHIAAKGTLLVHGHEAEAPAIVGDPAFHLDANATDSLTFEDGRLVRWADADGRDFAAVKDGSNPGPTVEADDTVDLDLANFGAMGNRSDQLVPCGESATLVFEGGAVTGIREVFVVFRDQPVYERPIPGEGGKVAGQWQRWQMTQNFLGNAKGSPQYFARTCRRRSGGGWYYSHLLDVGRISATGNCFRDWNPVTSHLVDADIRLDGSFVQPTTGGEFDHEVHVLSVGMTAGGVTADRLAANGSGTLGGIRLGEVLVYTHSLTLEERRRVNAYLMAKWHPERPNDFDFKWVKAGAGSRLQAADGTLRVDRYDVGATALKMEGNLDVTSLNGSNVSLAFSNGASNLTLRADTFAPSVPVPDKPAGTPNVWLDANRGITTFVTNAYDLGERTYVKDWVDARDGTNAYGYSVSTYRVGVGNDGNSSRLALDGHTMQVVATSYPCWPTLKSVGSLQMVDLGLQRQNDVTHGHSGTYVDPVTGVSYPNITQLNYFRWENACDGCCLRYTVSKEVSGGTSSPAQNLAFATGFWVLQVNETAVDGSGTAQTPYVLTFPNRSVCFGENLHLGVHYSISSEFADAEWYLNGERVDTNSVVLERGKTYVVGVRLRTVSANEAGTLGYYASGAGSGSFGGMCYGEYLAYAYALSDTDYFATESYLIRKWLNEDHPALTHANDKVELKALSFADAETPSVTNDRDLDVGALRTATSDSFVKRGSGRFTVASVKPSVRNYLVGSGSLKATVDWLEDAAFHCDASRTNTFAFVEGQEDEKKIDKWYDCRGNGLYAQSDIDSARGRTAYAVLAETGEEGEGGVLPGKPYVDIGAESGMYWYDADGARMTLANTREYHVVYMVTAVGNYPVIGSSLSPSAHALTPSGYQNIMFWYSSSVAIAAAKRTDGGAWYAGNRWDEFNGNLDTTKFCVRSFAAGDTVSADSFTIDRTECGHGHMKICEAIVFTDKTNTTERANAIHDYLVTKWKGIGSATPPTIELDSISAGGGASLTFDADSASFSVSQLATSLSTNAAGSVTFTTPLEFQTGSHLTVTLDDSLAGKSGVWTILSAPSVVNRQNLSVTLLGSPRVVSAAHTFWSGSNLMLRISSRGLTVWLYREP